jgi:hypothetical protein
MENGSEIIIITSPTQESVPEEIVEDAMSSNWHHFSEDEIVIIFSFNLIRKGIVCFIHSNKFGMSSLVVRIALRMIFKCKFSVGCFYLFQSCCLWHTQSHIVVVQRIWVMLIEEFLFFFIKDSMLIEESLEG